MNRLDERTRSMAVYAASHGEPDEPTTSRMRSRLSEFLDERGRRRARWRHWMQGAGIVVALIAVGGTAWLSTRPGDARGSIEATDETEVQLKGGVLRASPGAKLEITGDDGDTTLVQLSSGSVSLEVTGAVEVRTGPYEIRGNDVSLSIRATQGLPLVTVSRGEARLSGPDLPPAGVAVKPMSGQE